MRNFFHGLKRFLIVVKRILGGVVNYIMIKSGHNNNNEQETHRNRNGVYTAIPGKVKRTARLKRFLIKTALILGLIIIGVLALFLIFNAIIIAVTLFLIVVIVWGAYELLFRNL